MHKATKPHFTESLVDKMGLITASWGRSFEELYNRIGAGKLYNLGGNLTSSTTSVGNVGTGEDDLITYSLQKNTTATTGDIIEITAFGTFADNTNNKNIKLKIGTTQLFASGAVAFQNQDWAIKSSIIRTGSATQKCITTLYTDYADITNIVDYVSGTEDFTTALTIKCTGEATSSNDIVQQGLIINMFPV